MDSKQYAHSLSDLFMVSFGIEDFWSFRDILLTNGTKNVFAHWKGRDKEDIMHSICLFVALSAEAMHLIQDFPKRMVVEHFVCL